MKCTQHYHYAILTPREHKALSELIAIAEVKFTRELREEGHSTRFINKAINKIKNSQAK